MGTRGFVTFVIDGEEKTAYNHADSYPEKLGLDVLRWLRIASGSMGALITSARALRVEDPAAEPGAAEVRRLWRIRDGAGRDCESWYRLLRHAQGDPAAMLLAGVIPDAGGFPANPGARWGYVADIDAQRFEVYQGGQREPHDRGRFAVRGPAEIGEHVFYPAALMASWPFGDLPSGGDFTTASYGRLPSAR